MYATAGSADRAIASLQVARNKGALGDFGLDRRQLAGIFADLRQIEKESKQTSDSISGIGEGLEHQLGSKRLFDTILKGGAVGFIGSVLSDFTERAKDLREQFSQGKIDATGIVQSLLEGLPIIGGFAKAGHNIADFFDDAARNAERLKSIQDQIAQVRTAAQGASKPALDRAKAVNDATAQFALNRSITDRGLTGAAAESVRLDAERAALLAQQQTDAIERQNQIAMLFNRAGPKGEPSLAAQFADAQKARDEATKAIAQIDAALAAGNTGRGTEGLINARANQRENLDAAQQAITALSQAKQQLAQQVAGIGADTEASLRQNAVKESAAVTDAFKEQSAAIIKGAKSFASDLTDHIKTYFADMKKGADEIRKSLLTPAEQEAARLDRANALYRAGALSPDDLKKLASHDAAPLLSEMDSILGSRHRAYELPQVGQIRAGQSLYQSPMADLSKQQLQRLDEIRTILGTIRDKTQGEITIEELTF